MEDQDMAKKGSEESVYRVIDVIGSSKTSWEEAARNGVEIATKSLRDLRVAEVRELDVRIQDGKISVFRVRMQLSFKYEG
jgi:flavin-binding protein dodecin